MIISITLIRCDWEGCSEQLLAHSMQPHHSAMEAKWGVDARENKHYCPRCKKFQAEREKLLIKALNK
jgi:hypothetical protein